MTDTRLTGLFPTETEAFHKSVLVAIEKLLRSRLEDVLAGETKDQAVRGGCRKPRSRVLLRITQGRDLDPGCLHPCSVAQPIRLLVIWECGWRVSMEEIELPCFFRKTLKRHHFHFTLERKPVSTAFAFPSQPTDYHTWRLSYSVISWLSLSRSFPHC